jgi:hypothetical protein
MNQSEINFMLLNLSAEEAKIFFSAMLLLAQRRLAEGGNQDKNKKLVNVYANVLKDLK